MGRMLELLKTRDDARRLPDTKEPPAVVASDVVNEWSLRSEEVPYIEVGPNRVLEGSPQVLAAPAARREPSVARAPAVQPPHPPTEQALARTTSLLEPRPLAVAFEPVSGPYEVGKIASEVIAFHQPDHPLSRQYADLVTKILQSDAGKVLLFSGVRPGIGTSTVLLNLAVAASRQASRNITILDAQRKRPSLAARLGLQPPAFLEDVLTGAVGLEQALLKSPLPRLLLLAATAGRPEVALGIEALTWLLSTLKQRNDLVLLDGPSLDETAELSVLAPRADSLFLVTPHGNQGPLGRGLVQLVSRLGGKLRGLLHTQPAS